MALIYSSSNATLAELMLKWETSAYFVSTSQSYLQYWGALEYQFVEGEVSLVKSIYS